MNINDEIGDSGKLEKSEAEPNDFKDSGEKEIKRGMLPKGGIDAIKESVKEGRALREGKNKEKPKSDGPKPSISDFLKKIREAPVSDEPHEDLDKKPDKAIEDYESKEKAKAKGSKLDINEFLRRSREKSSPNEAANAKQEFIQHILKLAIKEKIDVKSKEKLIDLISKEYGKTGFVETEIIERLSKIEKKLAVGDEPPRKKKGFSGKYHKPKETYLLLEYFSSNEGGIKNLTHAFNLDFIEYDTFINQCKFEFKQGIEKYPNVPDALIKRIEDFAFSGEPRWYIRKGKEKIEPKLGWSEPKFIEWYKTEKKHPWDNYKYRNEMIIPFRESIRVRSDSEHLFKLINETFNLVFGSAPICELILNEEGLKHADFYTDVDNLGQAIFEIFSTIKDVSIKNFCNKIEVGFYTEGDYKLLFIKHIDSISTKRSDDKGFLGGNLKTIRNKLWGLCNYEIQSKFPNGDYRKIILTDSKDEVDRIFPIDDIIEGFTHILKFY